MFTVHLLHKASSFIHRITRYGSALLVRRQNPRSPVSNKAFRRFLCASAGCFGLIFFFKSEVRAATYAVNIQISTAAINPVELQTGLINGLTNQYLSSLTASTAFPGTYTLKVFGPNLAYQPPTVSTTVATLDSITKQLTKISTWTYVYGWADGEDYQRQIDMGIISDYILNCSTPSFFGASTTTWSPGTCGTALMQPQLDIYNLQFSTPTLIPPPGGF